MKPEGCEYCRKASAKERNRWEVVEWAERWPMAGFHTVVCPKCACRYTAFFSGKEGSGCIELNDSNSGNEGIPEDPRAHFGLCPSSAKKPKSKKRKKH